MPVARETIDMPPRPIAKASAAATHRRSRSSSIPPISSKPRPTDRLLGLELTAARQAGYDAIEHCDGSVKRLQIKGRCLQENCKPGQRLGSIRIEKERDAGSASRP
jgi:hypothetical protein